MCVVDAFDHQHLTSVSPDRRRAHLATLKTLGDQLAPIPVEEAEPEAVARFLADRVEDGYSSSTVRKWRAMLLAFYSWCWRSGYISGDKLLALGHRRVERLRYTEVLAYRIRSGVRHPRWNSWHSFRSE